MNHRLLLPALLLSIFWMADAVGQSRTNGIDIPIPQKFSTSVDGFFAYYCCGTAGVVRMGLTYQHHDFLGMGAGFAFVDNGPQGIAGYTLNYRIAPRRFSFQADAGVISYWSRYNSGPHEYDYTGERELFFILSAGWMPIPVIELGIAATWAPRISYLETRYKDPLPPEYRHTVSNILMPYPYIGVRLPGRWDRYKKN
jgi:hypothetical protein